MRSKEFKSQRGYSYGEEIRLNAVGDYMCGLSRKEIALKYKIYNPSVISHWVRKFRSTNSLSKQKPMKRKLKKGYQSDLEKSLERENALLRKELAEKERALSEQKIKARAYDMMIELAEKQFNIPIRKKSGPKQ